MVTSDDGFPGSSDGKESACNVGDTGLIPWSGRSLGQVDPLEKGMSTHSNILAWRRECPPTSIFLHVEFHGQRSLAGYSPWGRRVRHN